MIDHVWTVVCSRAVIDRDSNNVSIQNVLEQLTIKGKPESGVVVPIPLEAVTLWVRTDPDMPSRGRTRLTFLSPSGEALGEVESEIDLTEFERHRHRVHFQQLPVEESGRHVFRVELQHEGEDEWHQVAAIPLSIHFMLPDPEQHSGDSLE